MVVINCRLLIINHQNLWSRGGNQTTLSTLDDARLPRSVAEDDKSRSAKKQWESYRPYWPPPRPKLELKGEETVKVSTPPHRHFTNLGVRPLVERCHRRSTCQTTPLCHHQGLALSQYAARQGEISETSSPSLQNKLPTKFQPGQTTELLLCWVQLARYDWSRPSRRSYVLLTLLQSARAEFF